MWQRTFTKFGEWLRKDEAEPPPEHSDDRRPFRTVVPSLPRPITFARQNSEKRDKLEPYEPDVEERRATSADRRLHSYGGTKLRGASSVPSSLPNIGTSDLTSLSLTNTNLSLADKRIHDADTGETSHARAVFGLPAAYDSDVQDPETVSDALEDLQIQEELETKWILNLSMHFRDK